MPSPRQKRSNACSASSALEARALRRATRQRRRPAVARLRSTVIAARRPVPARVLDEVRERPLERGPVAAHRHRLAARRPRQPDRLRARASSSSATTSPGGAAASSRESASRSSASRARRSRVLLELGDELRRRAVPREVGDVAAQRGQRRAQLVRGVGEEAPLGVARALEAASIAFSVCREPADLVVRRRLGQPPARVAGALDLGRGVRRAAERPKRAPHQQRERGRRRGRGDQRPRARRTGARSRACRVEVVRRCRDDDRATGGRPADVGERRDVDAQVDRRRASRSRSRPTPRRDHARVRAAATAGRGRRARASARRSGRGGRRPRR